MSLREEIKPYIDSYGLVTPAKYNPANGLRGSDNGIMFTSEYYILLQKNNELLSSDLINDYISLYNSCITQDLVLCRAPGDIDQEGPDDYLGLLAGCSIFGLEGAPTSLLHHGYTHFGCYRNNKEASWGDTFLWRQPQIWTAMLAAAGSLRFYHLPLVIYTAMIIATSCMFRSITDTDARRLCWLLIQTMSSKSWLCRQAAKIWFNRGKKQYKVDNFMKEIAEMYYEPEHPLAKYMVTE